MNKFFLLTLYTICFLQWTSGHDAGPNENFASPKEYQVSPSVGKPWPLPQQYISNSQYLIFKAESFKFISNAENCSILANALKRYQKLLFSTECTTNYLHNKIAKQMKAARQIEGNAAGYLYNISVKINQCEEWPHMNMDEQYLLKINSADMVGAGLLFANSVWGALRGLETLSHITYQISNNFVVNSTYILDYPRFSYRGVLLDTSRHFVPVHILLQNLDAMAMNKMNVFHWHIVDDQSFPYVSSLFPDLSKKGAFNPNTHIYSVSDVANVIEYARQRGIRVLPEFDTPGHTQSWGKGQPGLLTSCYDKKGGPDGTFGPINPVPESSYKFLNLFFSEVAKVFPDDYVHLGGDEVSFSCWQSNPNITKFMQQHHFGSDYSKLEEYYMTRLVNIVKGLKKSYIVWQEVFDNNVKIKSDTVIHVWKSGQETELKNVTSAGYNALLSTCWYLNYISYGTDWPVYYKCDPQNFNGTVQQKKLVLGGEACMWGEYVDGTNVISRTWPRSSAVAERLWSSQNITDVDAAVPRLEEQRCRMMKRGLKVEPLNGPGFCECDYLV